MSTPFLARRMQTGPTPEQVETELDCLRDAVKQVMAMTSPVRVLGAEEVREIRCALRRGLSPERDTEGVA